MNRRRNFKRLRWQLVVVVRADQRNRRFHWRRAGARQPQLEVVVGPRAGRQLTVGNATEFPGITPYFAQLAVTGTRAAVTASPPQAHARPPARDHRSCCHRSCVACNDNGGGAATAASWFPACSEWPTMKFSDVARTTSARSSASSSPSALIADRDRGSSAGTRGACSTPAEALTRTPRRAPW